ncbi:MAG: DUF481 domain-containing protein [Woeseiaceae bacterium]|nr:DUF481 domain-containing protein [Woeseiaceae bacterium]
MAYLLRTAAALCLSVLPFTTAFAEKTDVVILINGNAVTGEIKSLEFGSLRYSTDSMGTVNIDWEDIVSLTSNQSMQVELSDGQRFFGRLAEADEAFGVIVVTPSASFEFRNDEVVRITPIDTSKRFLERLDGSLSAGFTTQKSSEVTTFYLATDVRYRTQQYSVGFNANTQLTEQAERDSTKRANATINYQRYRGIRWFTDWFAAWERNDELGILARQSIGGALGRFLIQTNRDQFSLAAGVQATNENFTGETDSDRVAEGRLQLRYQHRSREHESLMRVTSSIFPLIENPDVFRVETDMTFRRELIEDLFFDVSFYHSYQSDPPQDAANSDYGVTTSLGYSF